MVFVDTGAWFAHYVPVDRQHGRVRAWFKQNHEPLLTTGYCIDETLTLFVARGLVSRAIEVGRMFFKQPKSESTTWNRIKSIAHGFCFNSAPLPAGALLTARARL